MSYLFTISLCLSLLMSILLFFSKGKNKANYILSAFFFLASINIAYILVLYIIGPEFYIPFISEFNLTFPILYAPLIYFYAKTSILSNIKFTNQLPLLLGLYILYVFLYAFVFHYNEGPSETGRTIVYLVKPIVNIIAIIKLLMFIYNLSKQAYWQPKNEHFKQWLLWLAMGGLVICGISLTGFFLHDKYPQIVFSHGDFWICSFLSAYFFSLCVFAFTKSDAFQGRWMPKPLKEQSADLQEDNHQLELQLFHDLKKYMEFKKPYLDSNLSIAKLADQLELPTSKLSRIINQNTESTFFEFINTYRVEEVKSMIDDNQYSHLSLLGIALDCGFSNKTSFNRTFKRYTGLTPSQYRSEHKSS